jgi:prepilin-type N-terminal cleavage/methylation domain-containing protein
VKRGRAFTLVEVLLATVLLAALVIACLPMMRSPGPIAAVPHLRPETGRACGPEYQWPPLRATATL